MLNQPEQKAEPEFKDDAELAAYLSKLKNELSDDVQKEDIAEPVKEEEVVEKKEVQQIDYEAEARKRGWRPKEEFAGDQDLWVDAEEFVKREPLYKALHKVNRELKRQTEANEALKKFYQRQLQDKIKSAEAVREDAIARDDAATALQAEREINTLRTEEAGVTSTNVLKDVYEEWVTDNTWYKENQDMKEYADAMGMKIMAERKLDPQNISIDTVRGIYDEITTKVKKVFKEPTVVVEEEVVPKPKVIQKRQAPTTTTQAATAKVPTYRQLPDEAKEVYRQLVKSDKNPRGLLTHEEYMKGYVQAGGEIINGD